MIQKNIALISPNENAYSETFIQQHRNNIDGKVVFYFNGSQPKENDVDGKLTNKFYTLYFKLKRKLFLTKLSVNEQALAKSFKRQKIQIVITEYGTTGAAVLRVCKLLKLPLIPVFHGYDASIYTILEKNKTAYQKLFKYAHTIITVSNKIAETLITLGCNQQKIIVTPCAPDDQFFEIIPNFKKLLFVGVGRFVDKKAPYYTILAFYKVLKQFPEANLIIAGDGPLYNTCKNLIKHLEISKNVQLPGVIKRDELVNYFKHALAFVQHSVTADNGDQEGTPVAILEASAAGLPVISTLHAGIPDVIIDGKTGFLVKEHDVDEMAAKMLLLLGDFEKAKSMGEKGKSRIRNQFSKEQHIGNLNKIISEAVRCSTL